jgi:hypothetical protein
MSVLAGYTSITHTLIDSGGDYILKNWMSPQYTSCLKKEVLTRGGYFVLGLSSCITCAIDIIMGLGFVIGGILSLGRSLKACKWATVHLTGFNLILANIYRNFLWTINPKADFIGDDNLEFPSIVSDQNDGFVAEYVRKPFLKWGMECSESKNFLKRHVTSRLITILLAISLVIARVVDGVISIFAVTFSLLTLGKFSSLNNLAYLTLQAPGVIRDLFSCTLTFFNPLGSSVISASTLGF